MRRRGALDQPRARKASVAHRRDRLLRHLPAREPSKRVDDRDQQGGGVEAQSPFPQDVQRHRFLDAERPYPGAPQLRDRQRNPKARAQVARQGADVEPLRHGEERPEPIRPDGEEPRLADRDPPGRERDLLSFSRKGVGTDAAHLHRGVRRRDLFEGPHESRQRLRHRAFRRRGAGALLHGVPRGVAGVRGDAEREPGFVLLLLFRQVAGDLRGGTDAHREDAGGHRVEGAGVATLPLLEDPPHGLHRIEGGDPPGLVEDEHSRGHDNTAASASSTVLFTSGKAPGTVHPAALR